MSAFNSQKHPGKVCAIVVTYHPDENYSSRFCAIAKQVAKVLIIDNGSNPQARAMLEGLVYNTRHHLTCNTTNLGVATALNQGVRAAVTDGFEWAITLDQDSIPDREMVKHLCKSLLAHRQPASVALVGPNIAYKGIDHQYRWTLPNKAMPFFFKRASHAGKDMDNVTAVITSGALTNLKICEQLGMFWDELFIDYVDTEYCLRAKRAGYSILVSGSARLEHQLGDKQSKRVLGLELKPTFHSPTRLYYIARNRIPVMRRHALKFPHWFLFDIVAGLYNIFRIVTAENQKREKLLEILRGTIDGFKGKMGAKVHL